MSFRTRCFSTRYVPLIMFMSIFCAITVSATDLSTLSLSAPRSGVRIVEAEDKLYFVGGFEFNDQVATNKIDIFDLKTNGWDSPLTLSAPKGSVSPVTYGDKIYFIGGQGYTNPPAYYDLDLHAFISFNSSGPTVRTPISVSIYDNKFVVVGRFSVDFLNMVNGTWNHSAQLTSVMQQLSSSVAFSHEELVFVIGGINTTTSQQESRAWIFNISSNELTAFENVIPSSVNTTRPFKFEMTHGIVTACFSDACVVYHIASSRWIEQLAPIILTCVSVPDKTFIFTPNGFWTVDWLLSDIEPSWTSTATNITFAFGVASQACYIAPNTAQTGTLFVIYENNTWQELSVPFGNFIKNLWRWTDSRVVIEPFDDTAVYFYESAARSFTTYYHLSSPVFIGRMLPFNESAILIIYLTPEAQYNSYFTVVLSDGTSGNIWSMKDRLTYAEILIGTDLIEPTSDFIGIGMDSSSASVTISVLSGKPDNPVIYTKKGNKLVGMLSKPSVDNNVDTRIEVYNYKTKTWLDPIRLSDRSPYTVNPTVTDTAVLLLGRPSVMYNFDSGNWTIIPISVSLNTQTSLQFNSVTVNGTIYCPSSNAVLWIIKSNISTTREWAGTSDRFLQIFVYNDNDIFLTAGAYSNSFIYTSLYTYNIQTGLFQSELLPQSHVDLAMALTGDFLVQIGSDDKIAYYHIPTKTWSATETPFDTSYTLSTILTLSNGTVVFGGGKHRELSHFSKEIYFLILDKDAILLNVTGLQPQADEGGLTEGELAAAITVPIVASLIAAALIVIFVIRNKKNRKNQSSNTLGLENKYGTWFVDFNQIKFGDQLGQGASGQVFKGTWKNTTVALKVSMTQANSSVIHELELMMQLRPHPNVVQLLGFSVHPETDSIILIIEFCNGGSLDSVLYDSTNEISSEQQRQWLLSIAKGLSHLHSNNIVHRDVAARNVLLHQNEAKITDFGMSRLVDDQKQRGTTKSELGPIRWMSPESLKDRQYSTKSDVWSFGVLIDEVMSRVEPHVDANPIEIGRQIRDQGVTPTIPSDCPVDLENIMKQCWQISPEQRPTIDQLIKQLESASFNK